MKHSVPFKFEKVKSTKSTENSAAFRAVASTAALDRDREVLIPKGAMTENFMKNPVMLYIHNYAHVSVGKVTSLDVSETEVSFGFEFAPTDLGRELQDLYEKGFMNAFSVGFYPHKYYWLDEASKVIEVEYPDGKTEDFNLESYDVRPRGVISQWELLEISPVPVPSNPEALLQRAQDALVRKQFGASNKSAKSQLFKSQLEEKNSDLMSKLKAFMDTLSASVLKGALPIHSIPVDMEKSYDSSSTSLVKWSCEDGSGDKEKMNWGKYSKGFAWVDAEKADKFSSYKLPHHDISDGKLVTVWKGVSASMAELLSGKVSVGEEAEDVYKHLKAHYDDAGMEAPEFKNDYSEDELKLISEGTFGLKKEESVLEVKDNADAVLDIASVEDIKSVIDRLKTIDGSLDELDESLRIRMNLLLDSVNDIQATLSELKAVEHSTVENEDDGADKGFKQVADQMNDLKGQLENFQNSVK